MLFPACIQIKKKKNLLKSTEFRKKGRGAKIEKRNVFFWNCIHQTVDYIVQHIERSSKVKIGDVESLLDHLKMEGTEWEGGKQKKEFTFKNI